MKDFKAVYKDLCKQLHKQVFVNLKNEIDKNKKIALMSL